ncbi:hypothetical protein PAPHI01_1725 [Pancytospora philotis]|nr:hypothetical protein PAPHI01_1725 [Pancytospora philotis]
MASTKIIAIGASLVAFGVLLGGGCWYWGRESPSEPAAPAEASPADTSATSSGTSSAGKRELDLVPSFNLSTSSTQSAARPLPTQDQACKVLVGFLELISKLIERELNRGYLYSCNAFRRRISDENVYPALNTLINHPNAAVDFQLVSDEYLKLKDEDCFKNLRDTFADDRFSSIFSFLQGFDGAKYSRANILQLLSSDEEFKSRERIVGLARLVALYSLAFKVVAGSKAPYYINHIMPADFDNVQYAAREYISHMRCKRKYSTGHFAGVYVMDALAVANASDPKTLKFASIDEETEFCNTAAAVNILLSYAMLWEGDDNTEWPGLSIIKKNAEDDKSSYWTNAMQLAGARSEAELTPSKVMAMRATRPKLLATLVEHAMRSYQQIRRARDIRFNMYERSSASSHNQ